jgi:hypothetical protein
MKRRAPALLAVFLLLASACGEAKDVKGTFGLHGPEGGILEFDAAQLGGAGGTGATAGNGGGGASGTLGAGGATGGAGTSGSAGTGDSGGIASDGGNIDAGGGSSRCTGFPSPCSLSSGATCEFTRGCRRDQKCEGVSSSCYSQYSSSSCTSLRGCFWSSSSSSCSGSSWSCLSMSGLSECTGQDGCRWEDDCAGVATPCSLLTEAECVTQVGCRLERQ